MLSMILGATILLAVYIGKIFKHKQPTESTILKIFMRRKKLLTKKKKLLNPRRKLLTKRLKRKPPPSITPGW